MIAVLWALASIINLSFVGYKLYDYKKNKMGIDYLGTAQLCFGCITLSPLVLGLLVLYGYAHVKELYEESLR